MSLTAEERRLFKQFRQMTPGLREAVYPQVDEPVIKQLWGPVALHGLSLVAIFASLTYTHFFSDSKLKFWNVYHVRSTRLPIPTIECVLALDDLSKS